MTAFHPASLNAVPPQITVLGAEAFLKNHYADVRKRLGTSTTRTLVPRNRIRDGSKLYDGHKYPAPIGPRRVIYPEFMPTQGIPIRSEAGARAVLFGMADEAGIPVNDILSRRHQHELVRMRAQIAHRLRDHGLSYPVIGRLMNRDHTSIYHLCRNYTAEGERIRG